VAGFVLELLEQISGPLESGDFALDHCRWMRRMRGARGPMIYSGAEEINDILGE
jgi:hypothetical protein